MVLILAQAFIVKENNDVRVAEIQLAVPALAAVSGMVMLRKTPSRRPSSVCNSSMRQPCAASAMEAANAPLISPLGKTRAVTLVASSRKTVMRLTAERDRK